MLRHVGLYITGSWRDGAAGRRLEVLNPATGLVIGSVAHAETSDLDEAAEAAARGFETWRAVSAYERYKILRRAADIIRHRSDDLASTVTAEQGKPLDQARAEALSAADIVDWFAEEGRRAYGRVIPSRAVGVTQTVYRDPVGPVLALAPWNFPLNQPIRKVAAGLAAGCSVILKGSEETPGCAAGLVQAFIDAGVSPDALGLVFGTPAAISGHLIRHAEIRKVTFTGSTAVGKQLAQLAGEHMKRSTMELGGHAPVLVFDDAQVGAAIAAIAAAKFRNAGQVCTSPTRILVQEGIRGEFVTGFVAATKALRVGEGTLPGVEMGPLANARRVETMESLLADAVAQGAKLVAGGNRIGNSGYFFEPTVLTDVPTSARVMNEEPFGPIALINSFTDINDGVREANRLPYGLAAYAYSQSAAVIAEVSRAIESGMLSINHHGLALPETPFGGVKDSGYGYEGGSEALDGYMTSKFVSVRTA